MNKKVLGKGVALVMALVSACGSFACGGGGGDSSSVDTSNKTVISAIVNNKGYGIQWLRDVARRFEELNENTEFEPGSGKKGIYIEVEGTVNEYMSSMGTSGGYDLYLWENGHELRDLAQAGSCIEINSVLTDKIDTRDGVQVSIEDKIPSELLGALKGRDGNYYGLPLYENTPGFSYDVDLFEKYNLYFADDSETTVTPFTSSYGNVNFVGNSSAKKNCGNDGIYGTVDDGLPISLQDMLILCARMKQLGIEPVTMTGMYPNYGTLIEMGLWASLSGHEAFQANYTFEGEVEVVTGWTDEPLFQGDGLQNIKKPTTEKVTVTEKTGYKVYDSAARYYAIAFLQALQTLGWFSKDSETTTVSHTDAQGKFIMNGTYTNPKQGMIVEGSYWWLESEERALNRTTFFEETGKTERNIAMMALPTSLNGPRPQEGVSHELAFTNEVSSYIAISSSLAEKPDIANACKEFLKFMYTDAELEKYTEETGVNRAMVQYPISDEVFERMDCYGRSLVELTRRSANTKTFYGYADNETFKSNPTKFKTQKGMDAMKVTLNKVTYESHLAAIRRSFNIVDIFNATRLSENDWAGLYKGEE